MITKLEKLSKSFSTLSADILESIQKTVKYVNFEVDWMESNLKRITRSIKDLNKEEDATYRLPDHIRPREYAIFVEPLLTPGNFTFNGRVTIKSDVEKTTDKIVLHAFQINVTNVEVFKSHDQDPKPIKVTNITKDEKYDFLNVFLKTPIEPPNQITILINYVGVLNREMRGLYRTSYRNGNETR